MTTATIDFAAVKARQQATWASGDYAAVAAKIQVVAELLCDAADLRAGQRVLDVAAGTGNATIAAARFGTQVTGVDYVPALLERARERAVAERLPADLVEADAEALPFPDATFDAVLSVFGVMFAPDHHRAAAEILRVTRPGGTIALAGWTPDGFIGNLLRAVTKHVPAPAGVGSPLLWGKEGHVRDLFGREVASVTARVRTFTFRFASAAEFAEFLITNYGPAHKASEALPPEARSHLATDLETLAAHQDRRRDGGPVAIPSTYLEVIAERA